MSPAPAVKTARVERVSDFSVPGMAWVGTVRSPVSRGRIRSISIPHLPREYRSLVVDDIPGEKSVVSLGSRVPILASGRVDYLGEPVALVVGPEKDKVLEAVRLSKVLVDEETPEFGVERFDSSRILARTAFGHGDVDAAMASSERVVEGEFRMAAQDHYYPEPQGAAAAFDYDKLVVYASTQWPFHVRDAVRAALGVKETEVVVQPTLLGPHLDGKIWYPSLLACHAAIAALVCGKPALLLLSREEDFLYTTKRTPFMGTLRAGLDADGALTALDARMVLNVGAYGPLADDLVSRTVASIRGAYRCPNVRATAWAVSSNLPPMGAFAGIGTMPVNFARERLADECALAMDTDPCDWRAANMARRGDQFPGAPLKKPVPYEAVAERLMAMSDYRRKRSAYELIRKRREDADNAPGFGIGFAFSAQSPAGPGSSPGAESASVEVELSKDSTLYIRTSSAPGTLGTVLVWKTEAAAIIGVEPDRVALEPVRTDHVPNSGPATMSRNVSITTRLIIEACEGIQKRRFREALPISVRKSWRPRQRLQGQTDGSSWAGAVVELRLDPLDGAPIIRGAWLVASAGRVLSPDRARRSLERDVARAIGQCIAERLDLGRPADAAAYASYRLSRLKDSPVIVVDILGDESGQALGIGELAYATMPAAFANALSQAMDRPCNALPDVGGPAVEGARV